jgi:hypothetical protein
MSASRCTLNYQTNIYLTLPAIDLDSTLYIGATDSTQANRNEIGDCQVY